MHIKDVIFQPINANHLREAVDILIEFEKEIDTPFTRLLGRRYIENVLFKEFIDTSGSFGYVAVCKGDVIGFALASCNSATVYRRIIKKHIIDNAATIITQTFQYPILPLRIVQLIYHLMSKHNISIPEVGDVKAEFFSFHLSHKYRYSQFLKNIRIGVSNELFWLILNNFIRLGVLCFKAVVGARNIPMMMFYRRYSQTNAFPLKLFGEDKLMYLIDVKTALNRVEDLK